MLYSFTARVREATSADIDQVVALGQAPGDSLRWSRAHYSDALGTLSPARTFLVADASGDRQGVVGFIMSRRVSDEWEIENVVVAPEHRKNGLGLLLVASIVEAARRNNAARILLEVRVSNAAAIALYKKCGFQQDGLRKDYYSNPVEDALLFSLSLQKSS